ncbi:MAG: hypothetical protein HWE11_14505 [Gammaproteobacteria bacterium]|nr:hypothetical protein [Gammaproteobacteria bacterium]
MVNRLNRRSALATILLLICGSLLIPLAGASETAYKVTANADLKHFTVEICTLSHTRLVSTQPDANRWLREHSKAIRTSGMDTLEITAPGCHWLVTAPPITNYKLSPSQPPIASVLSGYLLWRSEHSDQPPLSFTIQPQSKAANSKVSLPLKQLDDIHYQWPPYRSFMSLPILFGQFDTTVAKTAKVDLQLVFAFSSEQTQRNQISAAIRSIAATLDPLYGQPQSARLIITRSLQRHDSALPQAMVYRGEGTSISMQLSRDAAAEDILQDWTLYHEFSHLLLPFIERQDAWLSEGFASYLQYPAMYLNAQSTAYETIENLCNGFLRGYKDQPSERNTLADLSKDLRQNRHYKRVYWSGAAFWLMVDLELRQQETGLPQLIQQFNQCCRNHRAVWRGEQLTFALDQLIKHPFIAKRFREYQQLQQFEWPTALFPLAAKTDAHCDRSISLTEQEIEHFLKFFGSQ